MKPFSDYQYIDGEMNERDRQEVGSKFWNEGKWNNFIKPFLPKECGEMTFIDIGCNAGLFLKMAKEFGFRRVIGVESNKDAFNKTIKNYEVINEKIEDCVDKLPLADITLLSNTHYYLTVNDWLKYLKKLRTDYCIIISAEKKLNPKYAPSDIHGIKNNFKDWEEIGVIDIPKDNTLHSRHLFGLCFKNKNIERVLINNLDNGNSQQRDFLAELDKGIDLFKTNYYRRLKSYRRHTGSKQEMWSKEKLIEYMHERVELYEDMKKNGLKEAIIVRKKDNRIVDGNHRCEIMKHLGHKSILIKYE